MKDKSIIWMGQSKKALCAMPEEVQDEIGFALGEAQLGRQPAAAKKMKGNLSEVSEIVVDENKATFRGVYTVIFEGFVYVLDVFKKKSKKGSATPKADLDRIEERLKRAREHFEKYGPPSDS